MTDATWLSKRLANLRTSRQRTGDLGEEQALHYLESKGCQLLQRSFVCKGGEIDLIMRDGNSLVFVEVRKRATEAFGGAAASITPTKQKRMTRAAQVYLQSLSTLPACRFDAVLIEAEQISWLKNVITA